MRSYATHMIIVIIWHLQQTDVGQFAHTIRESQQIFRTANTAIVRRRCHATPPRIGILVYAEFNKIRFIKLCRQISATQRNKINGYRFCPILFGQRGRLAASALNTSWCFDKTIYHNASEDSEAAVATAAAKERAGQQMLAIIINNKSQTMNYLHDR